MGRQRELKFALEKYWKGELDEATLLTAARDLRAEHWGLQRDSGIEAPPSNDFSLYDHVLDMAVTLGAIPATIAIVVMMMGRARFCAASRIAASRSMP